MVRLYEAGTDRLCGTLTDRQFEVLAEALEEEDLEDGECLARASTRSRRSRIRAWSPTSWRCCARALGDRVEVGIRCERS